MLEEKNIPSFKTQSFTSLDELSPELITQSANIYQSAFSHAPYNELFTRDEAIEALQYLFDKNGHLIIGSLNDTVASLAGGYYKDQNQYYIEELAVEPKLQGLGLGRITLQHLIELVLPTNPLSLSIRTNSKNAKAMSLYQTEGFIINPITEVVSHMRGDGRITLDERSHLTRNLREVRMEEESYKLNRVVVAYPSGNTTAIVFDQLLDDNRADLNKKIMDAWKLQYPNEPEIEQCCFVTIPKDDTCIGKVEMFGGEFCGNAARSVIYILTGGKDYIGKIESSSVDHPLGFNVANNIVSVEMPLPKNGEITKTINEGTYVVLDGIVHIVITEKEHKQRSARATLQSFLETNTYGLADEPACGVCYYNEETFEAEFAVWVKEVNTIFDETSCGSGTCCIGLAIAAKQCKDIEIPVLQPSGESIKTSVKFDNKKIVSSLISGEVKILFDDTFSLK